MLPDRQNSLPPDGAFESLYAALRLQARHYLRREQNAASLSPTVLVHEAWMALARSQSNSTNDHEHYLRLVSRVMKNLLVDHARRKRAAIRGGGAIHCEATAASLVTKDNPDEVLAVASAMDRLHSFSPSLAALVELRYFGGFTEAEAALICGISVRTVRRQWNVARLRMAEFMQASTVGSAANG